MWIDYNLSHIDCFNYLLLGLYNGDGGSHWMVENHRTS